MNTNNINHYQSVDNGAVRETRTSQNNENKFLGTSALGKDAFLQLLVTQLRYQDPLNPSSDTEFIAQLAGFSQLEAMQNLNQSYSNTQAFSLVGKQVVLKVANSLGTNFIEGKVDYVTIDSGKAYLSVNNNSYSVEDLYQVVDERIITDSTQEEVKEETQDN
ncbi:MAG: flagellar hook capping protein [Clostridiales bacterium]|nr:flagellar hook capping protein [Clostridiales bacterium]